MGLPDLPIEHMSPDDFNRVFKETYLNGRKLDEDAINQIKSLFRCGDPEIAHLSCDEYHAHDYSCCWYNHPITGVVERLVREVERLRGAAGPIQQALEVLSTDEEF